MPIAADKRNRKQRRLRGRRSIRPGWEALERRALLATAGLDPAFGQGGVTLAPAVAQTADFVDSNVVEAIQPDGKIVVAQFTNLATSTTGTDTTSSELESDGLTVRRDTTDGSPDPTFGTDGVATIPLPAHNEENPAENMVVEPDGAIVLALGLATDDPSSGALLSSASIVVRLTGAGQPDPSFGSAGVVTIPLLGDFFTLAAVQRDGKIVVAGEYEVPDAAGLEGYDDRAGVVRLTTAGTFDPSFGGTGVVGVPEASGDGVSQTVAAVAIDASGRIVLGGSTTDATEMSIPTSDALLARINPDGTVDSSFAAAAAAVEQDLDLSGVVAMGLQSDGGLVVLGDTTQNPIGGDTKLFARLLPDGTIDPSFPPQNDSSSDAVDRFFRMIVDPDNSITFLGSTNELANPLYSLVLVRELPTGAADPHFGDDGMLAFNIAVPVDSTVAGATAGFDPGDLEVGPAGELDIAGVSLTRVPDFDHGWSSFDTVATRLAVAEVRTGEATTASKPTPGDYDGDGKSDIAAALATFGLFAVRQSSGAGDLLESFGPGTLGGAIPAPGDYDGDGKTDIAAYLPAFGAFAIRPSSGGPDQIIPFGIPGAGLSIPAPGDYDGDGKTDLAVYLPTLGDLAYRPSAGGPDVIIPFGSAGIGQSIPAPGDYDGDGKTDPAVYLPAFGILAYRPSSGGADVLIPFGIPGAGLSIPAPGDYDGDGRTDVAAYFPALGVFAYRPSGGGADVIEPFGIAGAGESIPAPGDYDGDGRTDIAVYLPALGDFAYRPSSGGSDVIEPFGATGTGQTVPASSIPAAQPDVMTSGLVSDQAVTIPIALTEDALSPAEHGPGHPNKKHSSPPTLTDSPGPSPEGVARDPEPDSSQNRQSRDRRGQNIKENDFVSRLQFVIIQLVISPSKTESDTRVIVDRRNSGAFVVSVR